MPSPHLTYLPPVLDAIVLVRLLVNGLWSRYRWFSFFLLIDILTFAGLIPFHNQPRMYAILWAIFQPITFLAEAGCVFELVQQVIEYYPGIGRFADKVLFGCFGVAGITALGITFIELPNSSVSIWWLYGIMMASKCTAFACAILLIVQAVFFFFVRVPMSRNTIVHRRLLLVYFLTVGTVMFFAPLVDSGPADRANDIMLWITSACLLAWALLLTPRGEQKPPTAPISEEEIAAIDTEFRRAMSLKDRIRNRFFFSSSRA